jgi:hypothetical protein
MVGRPELTGGGYHEIPRDDLDDEFQPWTPGDASTGGEMPSNYASHGIASDGRSRTWRDDQESPAASVNDSVGTGRKSEKPGGSWWTEASAPKPLENGQRVKSVGAVGGGVFSSSVPAGTTGKITGGRSGLMGGEYVTVEFDNGYTEEVRATDVKRDSWW